jgi:DNA-binding transcriptional MerR regulator
VTIPDKQFFRIGEVARLLGVKTHVLRYWETEFPMVAPRKSASNQRVYRRAEVETLFEIRRLLYEEKYSIAGALRRIRKRAGGPDAAGSAPVGAELRRQAQELLRLARTPVARLFRY